MSALKRPEFHSLLLTRVRLLTEDAVGLTFLIPDERIDDYRFLPGQYLTLRADIDGADVRRCYSIASAQQENRRLEVGIKRVENGVFSNYACGLSAGAQMQVMTPQGNFIAKPGGRHSYLVVAAGSGITPCLSIIKSILQAEPLTQFSLVYGNCSTSSIMFADDIKALKDKYMERLSVIHIMSRERQDTEIFNGRIDAAKLARLHQLGMLGQGAWDAAFCCGPAQMIDALVPALQAIGVEPADIKNELFLTENSAVNSPAIKPQSAATEAVTVRPESAANNTQSVEACIRVDGSEKSITMTGRDETVLQAANRQGLDLPFSCAGGMCCTCRCKLVEGEVTMDANFSLAEWEVEAGFILACQARASSEKLVLDFDAF